MILQSTDLCGPNPAPISCQEVEALKSIMLMLPDNPVVVQIGAYIGVSTMAMLEVRSDAFIFSIDIKRHPEERDNLTKGNLEANRVVRVLGDSADIGQHWPIECDLLFIDGDHRYPQVKADILAWKNKVFDGGLIAFHDYIPGPPYPTRSRVQVAVDELMGDYEKLLLVERLKVFRG